MFSRSNTLLALFATCLSAVIISSCDKEKSQSWDTHESFSLSQTHREMMRGEVLFSRRLMKMLNDDAGQGSWSCSPLGVFLSLGMSNNIADEDASAQILEVMGLEGYSKEEVNDLCTTVQHELEYLRRPLFSSGRFLSIDNSIPRDITTSTPAMNGYNVTVSDEDNGAHSIMSSLNNWIENCISDIVPSPLSGKELDLAQGINLFDASFVRQIWLSRFDPDLSYTSMFRKQDGARLEMDVMKRKYIQPLFGGGVLTLRLRSYLGQMLIYQPGLLGYNIESSPSDFLGLLEARDEAGYLEAKTMEYYGNYLSMPIMKEDPRVVDMKDVLYRMGITKIFEDGILIGGKQTKLSGFFQIFHFFADETGVYDNPPEAQYLDPFFYDVSSVDINSSFLYQGTSSDMNAVLYGGVFDGND